MSHQMRHELAASFFPLELHIALGGAELAEVAVSRGATRVCAHTSKCTYYKNPLFFSFEILFFLRKLRFTTPRRYTEIHNTMQEGTEDDHELDVKGLSEADRIAHEGVKVQEGAIEQSLKDREKDVKEAVKAGHDKRYRDIRKQQSAHEALLDKQDPFGESESFLQWFTGWIVVLLPIAILARFLMTRMKK